MNYYNPTETSFQVYSVNRNYYLHSLSISVMLIIYKKAKKYFIENVDNCIKIAVIYSQKKIFAVNQSKEKNLHNRYEGKFYDIDII